VLLTIPPDQVRNDEARPVKLGFSSIFWNTAWTGRQAPTTLGVLLDPAHRRVQGLSTEFHSNWQWWYLVTRAGAMIGDGLPAELTPNRDQVIERLVHRAQARARLRGARQTGAACS